MFDDTEQQDVEEIVEIGPPKNCGNCHSLYDHDPYNRQCVLDGCMWVGAQVQCVSLVRSIARPYMNATADRPNEDNYCPKWELLNDA